MFLIYNLDTVKIGGFNNSMAKQYHHKDLLNALKARLFEEVREHGDIVTSIRGLSRDLGVSHNAFSYYFKSKDSIIRFITLECFKIFNDDLKKRIQKNTKKIEDSLVLAGFSYFQFCKSEPNIYRFMFKNTSYIRSEPEKINAAREAFAQLLNVSGDDYIRAYQAWSLVHGMCQLLLTDSFEKIKLDERNIDSKVMKILEF